MANPSAGLLSLPFPYLPPPASSPSVLPADVQAELDRGSAAGERMAANKHAESTKKSYASKIKQITKWMVVKEPLLVRNVNDQQELIIPLPETPETIRACVAFFGELTSTILKPKKGRRRPVPSSQPAPSLLEGVNAPPHATQVERKVEGYTPSLSHVRSYKSALVELHKRKGHRLFSQLDTMLESVLGGYEREIATQKLEGRRPLFEGKSHLTFAGYQHLCEKLACERPVRHSSGQGGQSLSWSLITFGWLFFVLQWNLMVRSVTCAKVLLTHISWQEDAMLVAVPQHKGDQEGRKAFAKHLYANPLHPFICPVLAMGVYVFCRPFVHPANQQEHKLFPGSEQQSRFGNLLQKVLACVGAALTALIGTIAELLGTHSIRKGGTTYLGGIKDGPSWPNIAIRGDWSLGPVHDQYVFGGAGGDQHVGRCLAGLPLGDDRFAILPPHFSLDFRETHLTEPFLEEILPGYAAFPASFKQAVLFLLASLVHHTPFLREHLSNDHPLWSTPLYARDKIGHLSAHVLTGVGHHPVSKLQPTGVPSNLAIVSRLHHVEDRLEALGTELPLSLSAHMLKTFSINGAVPVTQDALDKLQKDMIHTLKEMFNSKHSAEEQKGAAVGLVASPAGIEWKWWVWAQDNEADQKIHMVPKGFVLLRSNLATLWDCWYFGHLGERIRPYKYLVADDFTSKSEATMLSVASKVVESITHVGRQRGLILPEVQVESLSVTARDDFFKEAFAGFLDLLKPGSISTGGRIGEMGLCTVYNAMRKNGVFGLKRRRPRAAPVAPPAPAPPSQLDAPLSLSSQANVMSPTSQSSISQLHPSSSGVHSDPDPDLPPPPAPKRRRTRQLSLQLAAVPSQP